MQLLWGPTELYGVRSLWMDLYGALRNPTKPYGAFWRLKEPFGSLTDPRNLMESPYGLNGAI